MQLPVAHVEGAFEPLQVAPVLAVAALYTVRARSLALSGRPVPWWRQVSFASAMLLILVALVSPLGALDYELVWVHMAQHLLLADLGALLIVLGPHRAVAAAAARRSGPRLAARR